MRLSHSCLLCCCLALTLQVTSQRQSPIPGCQVHKGPDKAFCGCKLKESCGQQLAAQVEQAQPGAYAFKPQLVHIKLGYETATTWRLPVSTKRQTWINNALKQCLYVGCARYTRSSDLGIDVQSQDLRGSALWCSPGSELQLQGAPVRTQSPM